MREIMKKNQKFTYNPNIISEFHDPMPRLAKMFGIRPIQDYERDFYPMNDMLLDNAQNIHRIYTQAVELLRKHPNAISQLAMTLVPRYGDSVTALSDQKVGGIPDIRQWLYVRKKYANLAEVWPRCGVCHERMKFVGQFDLYPWIIPLTAVFGQTSNLVTGPFGGYKSEAPKVLTEHHSIFSNTMLHTFMCPFAGEHFDNPNFDSKILVTHQYLEKMSQMHGEAPPDDAVEYLDAYMKLMDAEKANWSREGAFDLDEKKIEGYDFRLGIDRISYDGDEDEIEDANPEIFAEYGNNILGKPRSQQTPKRPYAQSGYFPVAQRMTPFFNFGDSTEDFSYQIYADVFNDGYQFYCKVDGSCT